MERHRSEHGGYRYVHDVSLPWDGALSDGQKAKPRAIRNGLVRALRTYPYRPTQHEGFWVAFLAEHRKSIAPQVVHILAPGMLPASVCWKQLGDGADDKAFRIYDMKKKPKKARVCGFCWRAIERERERRERG